MTSTTRQKPIIRVAPKAKDGVCPRCGGMLTPGYGVFQGPSCIMCGFEHHDTLPISELVTPEKRESPDTRTPRRKTGARPQERASKTPLLKTVEISFWQHYWRRGRRTGGRVNHQSVRYDFTVSHYEERRYQKDGVRVKASLISLRGPWPALIYAKRRNAFAAAFQAKTLCGTWHLESFIKELSDAAKRGDTETIETITQPVEFHWRTPQDPRHVCPDCGDWKWENAKRCQPCAGKARRKETR